MTLLFKQIYVISDDVSRILNCFVFIKNNAVVVLHRIIIKKTNK